VEPAEAPAEAPAEKPAEAPAVAEAPAPYTGDTTWLAKYFGEELVKADGSKVEPASLGGKKVGIYFSAHWCPPCRAFTPVLVKAYNELAKAGKPFEVVFASSDRSEEAMFGYMKETSMPWVSMPFGIEAKAELARKYEVRGIPTLVILDEKGETITKDGRGDVASNGAAAFDKW
jgi:nucleoredoxin